MKDKQTISDQARSNNICKLVRFVVVFFQVIVDQIEGKNYIFM